MTYDFHVFDCNYVSVLFENIFNLLDTVHAWGRRPSRDLIGTWFRTPRRTVAVYTASGGWHDNKCCLSSHRHRHVGGASVCYCTVWRSAAERRTASLFHVTTSRDRDLHRRHSGRHAACLPLPTWSAEVGEWDRLLGTTDAVFVMSCDVVKN